MAASTVISLRGNISAALRIKRSGDGYLAHFDFRSGGSRPFAAYFISRASGTSGPHMLREGGCYLKLGDLCGAAVFDKNAKLLCYGAAGSCGSVLAKRLPELRIRALAELADLEAEAREPSPAASANARQEADASADITRSIMEKAKRLFAPAADNGAEADEAPASAVGAEHAVPADGGWEAVPNPFPRTYPNSYWRRRRGEAVLYGTAFTAGGKVNIKAVPAERGRRRMGYERFLTDVNGRRYYAHQDGRA